MSRRSNQGGELRMVEMHPGVPTAIFARVTAEGAIRGRIALTDLAEAIVRRAKSHASAAGSHAYGTPTPARPGSGPAMISRTLVDSLDRSPVYRGSLGWMCRIGTAAGHYPPYGRNGKPSSSYGYILEVTGCRNGVTYPFLYPAARIGFVVDATRIYTEKYGVGWTRIA